MNNEKLEELIMDYALGATTSDVTLLLEALGEKDAEVNERLNEWECIADLARRAGETAHRPALPAFPRGELELARRSRVARRAVMWVAGAAACVAIGFFGGTLRYTEAPTPQPERTVATVTAEAPVMAVADFWSVARLRATQNQRVKPATASFSTPFNWSQNQRTGG